MPECAGMSLDGLARDGMWLPDETAALWRLPQADERNAERSEAAVSMARLRSAMK